MELDGDPTRIICSEIDLLLKDFHKKDYLTKHGRLLLPTKKACPTRLYFLKKYTKILWESDLLFPPVKARPKTFINLLIFWLQPLMKALPSYLKDTLLINELSEILIEPNTLLVTIDVKSLYTCIPHQEGNAAYREVLSSTPEDNLERHHIFVLICLLEIVLKNDTFEFDNKFYKQLQGTAMGTKLAPTYANLFMGKLEHEILSPAPLKPIFYKRYIDDIILL